MLDAWEPEIIKVMTELGNDIVNSIYESNYDENTTNSIQRATHGCDNITREAWIKAKYIERTFILPVNDLALNDSETATELRQSLGVTYVAGDWHVRRMRRRRIKQSDAASTSTATESSSSRSSSESVLTNNDFSLGLDHDSTDGEGDDETVEATLGDTMAEPNANLLLYRAAAAHNLSTICYTFAAGAMKNWTNDSDGSQTALHQSILSVSECKETEKRSYEN